MTTETTRVLSGRYRVDDLIGRGGMASVYRGYDQTLGRTVAIKILKADLAGDAAFRTRFRLEAQAASRMAHPTIVRVFDAGEDSETGADGQERPVPYIVMELVHGRLLKDVIAEGPVPIDTALRYIDGILEALEYSHRAGVVHRDIKPGNVMITDAGQVKVMDFGIARAVSDSSSTVAETTAIVGTAAYFSNENAAIDLAAPGVNILTAVPSAFDDDDGRRDGYMALDGTSFAAPIVAAAAAWVRAVRPQLTVDQVAQVVRLSARDIGKKGWDPSTGFGALDLRAALGKRPARAR